VPIAAARLAPTGITRAADEAPVALAPETPVVCVSGLARPHDLALSARALGARVAEERAFADHHRFRAREWAAAKAAAARQGALLVVSAKDAARLTAAQRADAHVLHVAWRWVRTGRRAGSPPCSGRGTASPAT
jgi:tetraacyldisaccharide 4'-kinase